MNVNYVFDKNFYFKNFFLKTFLMFLFILVTYWNLQKKFAEKNWNLQKKRKKFVDKLFVSNIHNIELKFQFYSTRDWQ